MKFERPIVFFDLETTGLSISDDRIIEFCAIKVVKNDTEKLYYRLNSNGVDISPGAIEKHGITAEALTNEPTFADVAIEIFSFIDNCDLAGYNILGFDLPLLTEEFYRAGIPFNHRKHRIFDGLAIIKYFEPRNLESVYKKYTGKVLENAHSAEADVLATIEVIRAQLELYDIPNSFDELAQVTSNRDEIVDLAGKYKLKNGEITVNFGKHFGKNVKDVYKSDPRYFEWLQGASGFTSETKIITGKILNKLKSNI
jgi:DNA polymerase-3 subunit epsilon